MSRLVEDFGGPKFPVGSWRTGPNQRFCSRPDPTPGTSGSPTLCASSPSFSSTRRSGRGRTTQCVSRSGRVRRTRPARSPLDLHVFRDWGGGRGRGDSFPTLVPVRGRRDIPPWTWCAVVPCTTVVSGPTRLSSRPAGSDERSDFPSSSKGVQAGGVALEAPSKVCKTCQDSVLGVPTQVLRPAWKIWNPLTLASTVGTRRAVVDGGNPTLPRGASTPVCGRNVGRVEPCREG